MKIYGKIILRHISLPVVLGISESAGSFRYTVDESTPQFEKVMNAVLEETVATGTSIVKVEFPVSLKSC